MRELSHNASVLLLITHNINKLIIFLNKRLS